MKKDTEETIIIIAVAIIILISVLFIIARGFAIANPLNSNHQLCEFEYGEEWTYDYYSKIRGRTCVKIDFISAEPIDRKMLEIDLIEGFEKYCEPVGFFELSKWKTECSREIGVEKGE